MSNRIKTEKSSIIIVETIDLHGYRLENGIAALTSFLSECVRRHKEQRDEIWVTVITGSGQHSHDGPVLRQAVESTLNKREMIFWLNADRSSFTVRADSGFELHFDNPATRRDTKVVLQPNNSNLTIDLTIKSKKKIKSVKFKLPENCGDFSMLPCEVSADDKKVSSAKESSMREAVARKAAHSKELSDIEEALRQSVVSMECNDSLYKEELMLKRAIELSQRQASIVACSNSHEVNQKIVAISQCKDTPSSPVQANVVSKASFSDDSDLEAAIQQSLIYQKNQHQDTSESDIEAAIKQSLAFQENQHQDIPEPDIEAAIKESKLLAEAERSMEEIELEEALLAIENLEVGWKSRKE